MFESEDKLPTAVDKLPTAVDKLPTAVDASLTHSVFHFVSVFPHPPTRSNLSPRITSIHYCSG